MATVTAIVPNYNHARYLPQRLASVFGQTRAADEVILLDDASTDDSRVVLAAAAGARAGVRTAFNDRNSGSPFAQWNRGVAMARGEFVWIAESDDWAEPMLLERLVGALERRPTAAFAYCRSWVVDGDGSRIVAYEPLVCRDGAFDADFARDGRREVADHLALENTVPNASAVVFRRAAYEAVGGADVGFRVCGDWKLWVDLALRGDVAYVAEPLNHFRRHGVSVRSTTRLAEGFAERYRILDHLRSSGAVPGRRLDEAAEVLLRDWLKAVGRSRPVAWGQVARVYSAARRGDRHLHRRLWAKLGRLAGRTVGRTAGGRAGVAS